MFRYIALLAHPLAGTDSSRSRMVAALRGSNEGWTCALDVQGMTVFVHGHTAACGICPLPDAAGVVLGTLFERSAAAPGSTSSRVRRLDDGAAAAVLSTGGRELIASYWGRYVAFFSEPTQRTHWVLRAPMNTLPCYLSKFEGAAVVYSRLADYRALTGAALSVDEQQLEIRVATGLDRGERSLIREVSTVYPGECIEFAPGGCNRRFYWTPEQVASTANIESLDEAIEALERTTRDCVTAWGACYSSVLHLLSGGLDSSIVLGCLAHTPNRPRITCLNLWTATDNDSDEREYARLAAEKAACPLVTRRRPQTIEPRDVLRFVPQPAPINTILWALETVPATRSLAREIGAQAVFHGRQGDTIFFTDPAEFVGIDYVQRKGISWELFQLLLNVSLYTPHTVWELLRETMRHRRAGSGRDRAACMQSSRQLLSSQAARDITGHFAMMSPPWCPENSSLPPGKWTQATRLVIPSDYYTPLEEPEDPEITDPLWSQPLVDLCLRIPTYLHMYDGRPRAATRLALKGCLPPEIAGRYWKGAAGRHFKSLFMLGRKFFRELLLDGRLVRIGLLDPGKVAAVLADEPSKSTVHCSEMLDYIAVEAWLHNFPTASGQLHDAAAGL